MYLRHSVVVKDGKRHTYWRLVRSVREGNRVRQQHVAWLGELDSKGRLKAKALARRITGRDHPGQLDLFEPPPDETVEVRLKGLRVERTREFGDVWIASVLWNALRLDELFRRLVPIGLEDIPWADMIAALIFGRLCEPSSELHLVEQWFRKTALDDLLRISAEKFNDDRVYRTLDVLLPFKTEIEKHLHTRLHDMFGITYDILLYDVTSTYFEGLAEGNPLAQRGYSRDHRSDCKQVNLALVTTQEGLPLSYELFPGNTVDVQTVKEIVDKVEAKFGRANRIWIMDRGMVSAEVLEWLREGKRPYIVGTPRGDLKKFEAQVLDKREWELVREGLEVKRCPSADGHEVFILCRSQARRDKEQAMRARFAKRIRTGIERLENRLAAAKGRLDAGPLERQLGRLLSQNSRAAAGFRVEVIPDKMRPCGWKLEWQEVAEWQRWRESADGCYLLRASQVDWTPQELWSAYIQLVDVEESFRIHKTELELRPVWHHSAGRVDAHILVCFLAYVLWKTLEQWSERAGLGRSPRKLLEEFRQIKSVDVVLPTIDGRHLRLRCVTAPEEAMALLLERLGLEIPQRLRPPECIEDQLPVAMATAVTTPAEQKM